MTELRRLEVRTLGATAVATVVALVSCLLVAPSQAGADSTDASTLVGEGGSFLTPVTDLLLGADTGLAPLSPSYNDANIDNAITDFTGNGANSFDADFVVSERPLSSAETSAAHANGRTFAYVPFAATPVAVAALAVCDPAAVAADSEAAFCHNLQLTPALVAAIFTSNLTSPASSPNTNLFPALTGWNDPRIVESGGGTVPGAQGIYQASTLEPSAENTALLSLIDSDPAAREELDNALDTASSDPQTTSDAPSETWPFHGIHAWVGGDAGLVGKELSINAETNAPAQIAGWAGLNGGGSGDAFPLSAVWAGSPEGTAWNVPTAALENAEGAFVPPTEAAAAAAEADATFDPSTNLVTFNVDPGDAAAYNNYMMVESYLVVPTSGLSAPKAAKLAQFIRFVVGGTAKSDESTLGAAPPTAAMVTADLKVATQLDAEATAAAASSGSTTTTTAGAASGTTTTTSAAAPNSSATAAAADAAPGGATSSGSGSDGSGTGLAFTGAPMIVPMVATGATLLFVGIVARRRLRRREVKP